ncbi:MAG TPA: hypothetical protein VHY21_08245 [Pseudonocardiaceae bacterium]|nr:hypothetical protein [Pseudonocardiaceae bacterium]
MTTTDEPPTRNLPHPGWPHRPLLTPELAIRARTIGIRDDYSWPYGPNISRESRVALLDWAQAYGLRLSPRGRCLHWLTKGQCSVRVCTLKPHHVGWMDHVTGWLRGGKPAVLIAQPYGLGASDITSLHDLAQRHSELEVHIDTTGWYGARTVFVQVWRQPPTPAEPAAEPVSADIGTRPTAPTADAGDPPPFWRELI